MKKILTVSAFAAAGIAAAALVDDEFRGAIVDTAKTVGSTIKEKFGFDEHVEAEPDEEPEGPTESASSDDINIDSVIGANHDTDIIGYDSPSPAQESAPAEAGSSEAFDLK